MADNPDRILLLFVDGVGIGADDPARNPFATAELPALRAWLGGRRLVRGEAEAAAAAGAPLAVADATLGVDGLPQSGTGQTSLLAGFNAARAYGRHFGPWVPTPLRERLGRESVLARVRDAGRRAAFANATPASQLATPLRGWRRPAAPPLAAAAAGVEMRDAAALRAGRAVASSITNERWIQFQGGGVADIGTGDAARALAGVTAEHDLTLFAHYDTDFAGHQRELALADTVLRRLDEFLAAVLEEVPAGTLVVLGSDHGNVEDLAAEHTRNPVPVLAHGPGAERIARETGSIADLAPILLDLLDIETHP